MIIDLNEKGFFHAYIKKFMGQKPIDQARKSPIHELLYDYIYIFYIIGAHHGFCHFIFFVDNNRCLAFSG